MPPKKQKKENKETTTKKKNDDGGDDDDDNERAKLSQTELNKMTVKELKLMLDEKKLSTVGIKKVLIERLLLSSSEQKEDDDDDNVVVVDVDDEEKAANVGDDGDQIVNNEREKEEEEEGNDREKKQKRKSPMTECATDCVEEETTAKKKEKIIPLPGKGDDKTRTWDDNDDDYDLDEFDFDDNIETFVDKGFLETKIWQKIREGTRSTTTEDQYPRRNVVIAFAKVVVYKARTMNVRDAFETLGKEEEDLNAMKMTVEKLTDIVFEHCNFDGVRSKKLETRDLIAIVRFFNVLMNALENDCVRKVALPLVSIQIWKALNESKLDLELKSAPNEVQKKWQKLKKKELKQAPTDVQYRRNFWLANITKMFCKHLTTVNENVESVHFCAYYLEFVIDLLSQLPTRRFVRAIFDDQNIFVKGNFLLNDDDDDDKKRQHVLLRQLLEMAKDFYDFEVDNHTGEALSEDDIDARRSNDTLAFQRLLFKFWPDELKELALSSSRMIETKSSLTKQLKNNLSSDEIRKLCCEQLKLTTEDDILSEDDTFLLDVIAFHFEKRQSRREMVNKLPLYPTEDILFDESLVPSTDETKDAKQQKKSNNKNNNSALPLALPKLNLQFLTFSDYLLRNFNLFRLEATHEIRADLSDAIQRMQPSKDGKSFRGWAKMAMMIPKDDPHQESVQISYVGKPNVGEEKPSKVRIKINLNFSSAREDVFKEWDELKRFDVVFLVKARQDAEFGSGDSKNMEYVRGAEIVDIRDDSGVPANEGFPEQSKDFVNINKKIQLPKWHQKPSPDAMDEGPKKPSGYDRIFTLELDCAQYQRDLELNDGDVARLHEMYKNFNCVVRRHPKENNFKAILECIRDCLNQNTNAPEWLTDVFLGYGDPASASPDALEIEITENNNQKKKTKIDFKDTFLDEAHLRESFPGKTIVFDSKTPQPPFKVTFDAVADKDANNVTVESYVPPDPGPYPEDIKNKNLVRFTPTQVDAVKSGVREGLTLIVGPPGTGKTDVATQILHCLYHTNPNQRVVLITHSNAALNDLFQKIMIRDIPERYLLRLGRGEEDLTTDKDFSRTGRVDYMLRRRLELLESVERLAMSIDESLANVADTCETAGFFWKSKVLALWERFTLTVINNVSTPVSVDRIRDYFPFAKFFADVPCGYENLFGGDDIEYAIRKAKGCFRHLVEMFKELEECRFLELLKMPKDRAEYLLTKQAKIVAMTCTYAALKRADFLDVNFKYDTVVFEEAAQILEIESFIPLALQKAKDVDGHSRLKRIVMIGDHNQLPPVVKNQTFSKFCNMDQSCFARLVRSGVPNIVLDAQGRSRKEISKLYSWRYKKLDDLPHVSTERRFQLANAGLAKVAQFIDCSSFAQETCPNPHYFQNLQEAEYLCSLYQWMRLCGYPANSISVLTTYRGQKHLLRDVFRARCDNHPLFGKPASISTVDKYQGQQNDIVLLSLVRTKHVGHLRDVRRLVVSLSRARLGVYVFGSKKIFEKVDELKPALKTLLDDTDLSVIKGEVFGQVTRKVEDVANANEATQFNDSNKFAAFINDTALQYKEAAMKYLKNQQQQ